jgi:hypothetical protein
LLSFTFHYDGRTIVFDGGGGGDKEHLSDYARSAVAHSALLCDESDYITPDYNDFTAMEDAVEKDDYVFVAAKHILIEGVKLKRYIVWIKPNVIVICDEAESEIQHIYTQNFLFPLVTADDKDKSRITLEIENDYSLTVSQLQTELDSAAFEVKKYTGTTDANADENDLRGSHIQGFKRPVKLLNLAYEKHGKTAKFLTVLEAHSGKAAEARFESAAVENGVINVRANGADKIISISEKLDRGFGLF